MNIEKMIQTATLAELKQEALNGGAIATAIWYSEALERKEGGAITSLSEDILALVSQDEDCAFLSCDNETLRDASRFLLTYGEELALLVKKHTPTLEQATAPVQELRPAPTPAPALHSADATGLGFSDKIRLITSQLIEVGVTRLDYHPSQDAGAAATQCHIRYKQHVDFGKLLPEMGRALAADELLQDAEALKVFRKVYQLPYNSVWNWCKGANAPSNAVTECFFRLSLELGLNVKSHMFWKEAHIVEGVCK